MQGNLLFVNNVDVREFMEQESLTKHSKYEEYIGDVKQTSGIYAITVNDFVAYVGKAQKIRRRVRNHIRYATKGYDRAKYELLTMAIDDKNKKEYQVKCVVLEECPIDKLGDREKAIIKMCDVLPLNTQLSHSPAPKSMKFEEFILELKNCKKLSEVYQELANKV